MTKRKIGIIIGTALLLAVAIAVVWWSQGSANQVEEKLNLAVKYLGENSYEKAVLAFNEAIEIDPKEVKAYQGLAKVYTLQGKYDDAKATYDRGLSVLDRENQLLLQLGLSGMYIDQGQFDKAEQGYQHIIDNDAQCLEAYRGLAMVCQQKGNNTEAETILKLATERNPEEYQAYNALALFQQNNGQKDAALDNLVKSLALEVNQQEAYLIIKKMYGASPAELVGKMIRLPNQKVANMINLYAYYIGGDYQNVLNTYGAKLKDQPGNDKAITLAAIAMYHKGQTAEADKLIQQLSGQDINTWLLSDIAEYYLATGDREKAKMAAIKALEANRTNLEAIALLQKVNKQSDESKRYAAEYLLYTWQPIAEINEQIQNMSVVLPFKTSSSLIKQKPAVKADEATEEKKDVPISQSEQTFQGNNIVNGGLAARQGDWIYYTSNDNGALYKMRTDGSGLVRLTNDDSVNINVAGDWIYYRNQSCARSIYKIRTDGSGRVGLNNDKSIYINVAGDWIYYCNQSDNDKIYKMRTDGSERVCLNTDESDYLIVAGDWIYYRNWSDKKLYKMHTDGSERVCLTNGKSKYMNVVGDWIYYTDGNEKNKLSKMRTDGSGRVRLTNDWAEFINVAGDWIYYSNVGDDWKLYKMRTDGSGQVCLNNQNSNSINVAGDWIYYQVGSALYKMRTDGSEKGNVEPSVDFSNN